MAKHRPRQTLADYMVIAISPALIIALVGSLVLFLIELFYQGQYQARMQYVFALFVFAAVLIGRISIEEGRERALGFSLVLSVAVLLVLNKFVDYSGFFDRLSLVINIGLIGVILWCSNKLTWDCTVIDYQEDASGEGLLQTMGMDDEADRVSNSHLDMEATSGSEGAQPKPPPKGLWQRFVEARKKKHAPGVWVVYFSMAALPIFGIGQGFIFNQDLSGRRFVFKLLVVYVAAALGLLVTTSFLGLRRYLRQRRLEMPSQMAGAWLGIGAAMIVALLLFCMLLPRRNAEYSVTHIPAFAKSPTDLKPNKYGFGNDGPEGEDAKRQVKRDDAKQQSDQTGDKQEGGEKGEDGEEEGGKKKSDQQGEKQGSGKKQDQSKDGKSGEKSQGKQDKQSGKSEQDQSKGKQDEQSGKSKQEQSKGKQKKQSGGKEQEQSKGEQNKEQSESKQQKQESSDEKRESSKREQSETKQQQDDSQSRKQTEQKKSQRKSKSRFDPAKIGGGIGTLMKLLYWLIAILIVGWFVWRYWEQVREAIRNFIQAMKEFWARLFGGTVEEAEEVATDTIDTGTPPRPFSDFPNPFQTDLHARLSVEQLVAYSFEAFEAWARERGFGRGPEQTPHEFASLVGQAAAPISQDAIRLAELYNRSAYSAHSLPAVSVAHLRQFWTRLTAVSG
ncbi:MAG: hypothetical protein CMJ64_10300 [Planctomycetaceae bacterium]|nr:hypothetical protein [Planctomycetaceae bacterium]